MIAVILASTIFAGTGTCHVPVVKRVVAHQVNYGHQAVAINYGHANYTPYYTASALAYKVEDPEKAALQRIVEKQSDALIGELKAKSEKIERLEATSAGGTPTVEQGSSEGIPKLANKANDGAAMLKQACGKCHGGGKSQGEFTLELAAVNGESAAARKAREIAHKALMFDAIESGEMPPKSEKPLSDEQKQAVADYLSTSRDELKAAAKGVAAK
jgi:mono/diheme cytochrome c family protein